jgi:predicted nucleic acid-binding protein
VEFVSLVTRGRGGATPLMAKEDAARQVEMFILQFPLLYPNEYVVRTALRGMTIYRLSWIDAHQLAFAEHYGISEILSEDFTHGQYYGKVLIRNPFLEAGVS